MIVDTVKAQEDYILKYGEANGLEVIVSNFLDTGTQWEPWVKSAITESLTAALIQYCGEFEIAQWAASIQGEPDFEDYLESLEDNHGADI